MRFPPTGLVPNLTDRRRRRLSLLRGQPKQLASMRDVVVNEPVKSLLEGQALLQDANLLSEGFRVRVYVAR
jgi:hypothetical protein